MVKQFWLIGNSTGMSCYLDCCDEILTEQPKDPSIHVFDKKAFDESKKYFIAIQDTKNLNDTKLIITNEAPNAENLKDLVAPFELDLTVHRVVIGLESQILDYMLEIRNNNGGVRDYY